MGAVTSILYAEANLIKRQTHISCMVLDSPFSQLATMVDDVGTTQMGVPSFIISLGLSIIKSTIKSKIKFDITKLDPLASSKKLNIPAAFITAKEDKLVLPKRMAEYFQSCKNKRKVLIESAFEHNSDREPEVLQQAFTFLTEVLDRESDEQIADLGADFAYEPKSRKISEDERIARAKSRELDYELEGAEKEELALFFKNMDLMRDSPPKSLKTNISIFDDDEPTHMDFEAREKLMKITGKSTALNMSNTILSKPIIIQPIRPTNSQSIVQNLKPIVNDPSSRIKVLGRGPMVVQPPTYNPRLEVKPQWHRQETATYVTKLKDEKPREPSRRRSRPSITRSLSVQGAIPLRGRTSTELGIVGPFHLGGTAVQASETLC
jgi:hypothetical protein